jgi:hypothetical protein
MFDARSAGSRDFLLLRKRSTMSFFLGVRVANVWREWGTAHEAVLGALFPAA